MSRNKKILATILGGSIGGYLLSLPFRLLEDWMMGELVERIGENWSNIITIFITWVLPFIVVFGAIFLGYWLRRPNYKNAKQESIVRADYCSGYVYINNQQAGANMKVVAKVGDYISKPVFTNQAGYYQNLEVLPPNESYKGLNTEFYVDGKKVISQERLYMGGGHSSNFCNLNVRVPTSDTQDSETE